MQGWNKIRSFTLGNSIVSSTFNSAVLNSTVSVIKEKSAEAGKAVSEVGQVLVETTKETSKNVNKKVTESEIYQKPVEISKKQINSSQNFVRSLVSQEKHRYVDDDFDLDLTYITNRIVAMGFPAENIQSTFRNSKKDLGRFFEKYHSGHYLIFNLTENTYDNSIFNGNVKHYFWKDEESCALNQLFEIVKEMENFLQKDDENIVALHCLAGRGRTGTAICSYLVYTAMSSNPDDALELFGVKRSQDGRGVTNPSQRRYVHYLASVMTGKISIQPKPLILKKIILKTIPIFDVINEGCTPSISVENPPNSNIFDNRAKNMRSYSVQNDEEIEFEIDVPIEGDVTVRISHNGTIFFSLSTPKMCRFAFNTCFIENNILQFNKNEIELACNDNRFRSDFNVQLFFEDPNVN